MRIYAPTGAVGQWTTSPAPPLPVLAGRRIGVLDNGKPNAGLLLGHAAARLAERTGATVTVVTGKGDGGANAATAADDTTIERLAKEVDLVLTGSAD